MTQDSDAIVPSIRRKRSDRLAARLRELIAEHGLKPGDRMPQAWLAEQETRASKGTVREAMKALETQGLIKTRTGPGGGAFVTAMTGEQAIGLLSNLFLFNPPSIDDICTIRAALEADLAAGLAGQLDAKALAQLQASTSLFDGAPVDAGEEFRQRIAGLDFHGTLAALASNRLLGFLCAFLQGLLRDMASCAMPDAAPSAAARDGVAAYQLPLLRALKKGDATSAHALMKAALEQEAAFLKSHGEIGAVRNR